MMDPEEWFKLPLEDKEKKLSSDAQYLIEADARTKNVKGWRLDGLDGPTKTGFVLTMGIMIGFFVALMYIVVSSHFILVYKP